MAEKKCSGCELIKNINQFHKNKTKFDGLNNICKICKSLYHNGFKKQKKLILVHEKKRCSKCEEVKELTLFFKSKHTKDNLTSYCKKCIVKRNFIFYQKNKKQYICTECDAILIKYGKFCEQCRLSCKKKYKVNYGKTRRQNISYKLKSNISRSVREAIKIRGSTKGHRSILKYLNYSIDDLKQHLEKQFQPWMNWQNYGEYRIKYWDDNDKLTWKWNIDHIIPQSKFHFTNMQQIDFNKCWELKNLRPYSAKQNLADGNRR